VERGGVEWRRTLLLILATTALVQREDAQELGPPCQTFKVVLWVLEEDGDAVRTPAKRELFPQVLSLHRVFRNLFRQTTRADHKALCLLERGNRILIKQRGATLTTKEILLTSVFSLRSLARDDPQAYQRTTACRTD